MKKLSAKEIIEFRSRSDKSKKHFVQSLIKPKEPKVGDGGGDYWISCLSALSNCYRDNSTKLISDKITVLTEKIEKTDYSRVKNMYRRNIEILSRYQNLDLRRWKRVKKMTFIRQYKSDYMLTVRGTNVNVSPHRIFIFQKDGIEQIGGIWFVAQLDGYQKEELGVFTELLYLYINKFYGKKYKINEQSCIAVDVINDFDVSYAQISSGTVKRLLHSTLIEIQGLSGTR